MRTSLRGTPSSSAINRISALFAAPSTAGAPTRARRTPSITPSTRSTAALGVRRTAKRTSGGLKISEASDDEPDQDEDDEPGPVDHAGLGQHPADRTQDRFGGLMQKRRHLIASRGVDPGHDHPPEDQRPERHQEELDEGEKERPGHVPESTSPPSRGSP